MVHIKHGLTSFRMDRRSILLYSSRVLYVHPYNHTFMGAMEVLMGPERCLKGMIIRMVFKFSHVRKVNVPTAQRME